MSHRPIGIGVQGLADAFIKMRYPYDSKEAAELNKLISEAIYFGALSHSTLIAKEKQKIEEKKGNQMMYSGAYKTFAGSPLSQGIFHWEMWNEQVSEKNKLIDRIIKKIKDKSPDMVAVLDKWRPRMASVSQRWDWETLRSHIKKFGVVNSMFISYMPTASTSQINGNNECFEPITSNIYKRKTLAGNFVIVNKYLMKDLCDLKLWNDDVKFIIENNGGSIQEIECIPQEIKDLYKTARELSNKTLIDMSADRQPYIDQGQSFNHFPDEDYDFALFNKIQVYGWCQNLKTASYYIRHKVKVSQTFDIDKSIVERVKSMEAGKIDIQKGTIEILDDEGCLLCGS